MKQQLKTCANCSTVLRHYMYIKDNKVYCSLVCQDSGSKVDKVKPKPKSRPKPKPKPRTKSKTVTVKKIKK